MVRAIDNDISINLTRASGHSILGDGRSLFWPYAKGSLYAVRNPDGSTVELSVGAKDKSVGNLGTIEASDKALPVGTILHEFEIVGVIGLGGFSFVYLARDHSLRRTVAREVDRRLSRMLLAGEVAAGDEVRVDVRVEAGEDELTVEVGGDGRG